MNQQRQEFIQYIPWNDQVAFLPAFGAFATCVCMIFNSNQSTSITILTQAMWICMLELSKRRIQKYYKTKMQEIVSKVINREENLQTDIKVFNTQQRQTYAYIQIMIIAAAFQMVSAYLGDFGGNIINILTYSILALFIYLSNKHFNRRYQSAPNSILPYQIYVIQGTLVILSFVIAKYVTEREQDNQFTTSLLLLSSAIFTAYSLKRFGLSSRKSFAYTMIGGLFLFLSDSLFLVVSVQRQQFIELVTSASVLYQAGYYFVYVSVFLHAKAFNDHYLISLAMKYHI